MMKLKNLICDTDEVANEILKNWQHDSESLKFWRGSANYVYLFMYENQKYWLRFSKKDENSLDLIKAEMEFILYLNNSDYPFVRPIKSKKDRYIEVVKIGSEEYYAVVFSDAQGINLDIDVMTESQFEVWGKTLASLHNLSKNFKPKKYVRNNWKEILKFAGDILSDLPEEKEAINELSMVEKWLNSLSVTSDNYGLIHYDFELDNIFFNEQLNKFNVIDFDSSMYHWYVMDIVCALGDLDELESSKAEMGLQYFLKGYCSIRDIKDEDIKLLPKFKRFSNLVSFTRLLRSLKDSDFSKEPDWLKELRPRLLRKCDVYREGFKEIW